MTVISQQIYFRLIFTGTFSKTCLRVDALYPPYPILQKTLFFF